MGLFDRMKDLEALHPDWEKLTSEEQIPSVLQTSHATPVVLFKHSIRCGTSAMVKWMLEKDWDFEEDELRFYYLDLIRNRLVSDAVADTLGVIHQSPQIIVLSKSKVVFHTSHHMISIQGIRSALSEPAMQK